jgi:hypothetical protein
MQHPLHILNLKTKESGAAGHRLKVLNFFLNNQPDALIIPILIYYKTLHVSGTFSAHQQEFSTVHSAFHPDSAWKRHQKPA